MIQNLSLEAMPQNLAALSEQVSDLSNAIGDIKTLIANKQQPQPTEEFIGMDEACEVVHLAKPTLYKLCQKSAVPYYKPAKELLFRKSELIKWVENSHKCPQTREEMEAELRLGNRRKPKSKWD